MADIIDDPENPVVPPVASPITTDPSAAVSVGLTVVRQILILVAGGSTVLGFVKARDLIGLIAWMQGNAFALIVSTAVAFATLVYGWYRAYTQKRNTITLTKLVPDTVAVIQSGALTKLLTGLSAIFKKGTPVAPSADGK